MHVAGRRADRRDRRLHVPAAVPAATGLPAAAALPGLPDRVPGRVRLPVHLRRRPSLPGRRGEPPIAASRMRLLAVAVAGLGMQVAVAALGLRATDQLGRPGADRGDGRSVPRGPGAALLRPGGPQPPGGRRVPPGRARTGLGGRVQGRGRAAASPRRAPWSAPRRPPSWPATARSWPATRSGSNGRRPRRLGPKPRRGRSNADHGA